MGKVAKGIAASGAGEGAEGAERARETRVRFPRESGPQSLPAAREAPRRIWRVLRSVAAVGDAAGCVPSDRICVRE